MGAPQISKKAWIKKTLAGYLCAKKHGIAQNFLKLVIIVSKIFRSDTSSESETDESDIDLDEVKTF